MANTETLNVTLPAHMVAQLHEAVAEGAYASSDELVSEALYEWSLRRQGLEEDVDGLRAAWQEAMEDDGPGIPMDEVFDRVEAKSRAMAEEAELVK
jgi:antitoxin ParD1/3/4